MKNGKSMKSRFKALIIPGVLAFSLLCVATYSNGATSGANELRYMQYYAETHNGTPDSPTLTACSAVCAQKKAEQKRLQKEFAVKQKAEMKALQAAQKAKDKAALKDYRKTVTHNADLSKNQQKALIKQYQNNQKAADKVETNELKAQQKVDRSINNREIKNILKNFLG